MDQIKCLKSSVVGIVRVLYPGMVVPSSNNEGDTIILILIVSRKHISTYTEMSNGLGWVGLEQVGFQFSWVGLSLRIFTPVKSTVHILLIHKIFNMNITFYEFQINIINNSYTWENLESLLDFSVLLHSTSLFCSLT